MKPTAATMAVAEQPVSAPSLIEIESSVLDKLREISLVEKIPLKSLVNRLLSFMLIYHRKEVKQLIERMKCPEAW